MKDRGVPSGGEEKVAIHLFPGIKFLHTKQIIHRDIKTQNCLVTKHWGVAVIDFGVSRVAVQNKPENSEEEDEEDPLDVTGGAANPAGMDVAKMTLVGTYVNFFVFQKIICGV
jgi:serine/threonine protein kinase